MAAPGDDFTDAPSDGAGGAPEANGTGPTEPTAAGGVPEIPDLAPELAPLWWLIGEWEGEGQGDYPTIQGFHFGQHVTFSYVPGKAYLEYASRSWLIDSDGIPGRQLARETGYWRPLPDGEVEVLLTHPTGIAEIWIGTVEGRRVELRTDAVARTATAKPYVAGHRLYGMTPNGTLGYVFEMAAMDQPMGPHLAAELHRT